MLNVIKKSSKFKDFIYHYCKENSIELSGRKGKYKYWPEGSKVFNYGVSDRYIPDSYKNFNWINKPSAVRKAVNKKLFFNVIKDKPYCIPWTTSKDEALAWDVVFIRNKLEGKKGEGIEIFQQPDDLPDSHLYTKGIYKIREVRVFVYDKNIHLILGKKLRNGYGPRDCYGIWNAINNYIFTPNVGPISDKAKEFAIDVINTLGLDYGAVDMCRDDEGGWYVLEVNTAPGIVGNSTSNLFKEMLDFYKSN